LQAEAARKSSEQEQSIAGLQGRLEAMEGELRQLRQTCETDASLLEAAKSELRGLRAAAEQRDREMGAFRAMVERDNARCRKDLAIYRGQRAWTLMLVARKAYTLLCREGWRGRWHFLWWLPALLLGRTGNLEQYELRLPCEQEKRNG
jgi:hypothetical protein